MKKVRLGIIGHGSMGSHHSRRILAGEAPRVELAAICDMRAKAVKGLPDSVQIFTDYRALLKSGLVDAVLIATPHYDHTVIGIAALKAGLHVLVEKPISVHKADAEKLVAAYPKRSPQVFAAMFNQRTDPCYQKVRALIQSGELGALQRVNWIITTWFRSQAYYDSSAWRATWAGEGGGVLLNQCPHQLDLLQWLFGMPERVQAFGALGKYHRIEVEDEITAYLDFPNRVTGVFITSTGEAPGTNRLEITAQRGRLIIEDQRMLFLRNEIETAKFSKTNKTAFGVPPTWQCEIPLPANPASQHMVVLNNFADAILDGTPLLAPAVEGIRSVELGNAMLYSALTGKGVTLPLNAATYARFLKGLIKNSKYTKKVRARTTSSADLAKSFS